MKKLLRALLYRCQAYIEDNNYRVFACRCGVPVYRVGYIDRDYPTDQPHSCKEKRAPQEVRAR